MPRPDIQFVTLPEAARILGRHYTWAVKNSKKGRLGPLITIPGSKLKRVSIFELERRFGKIDPNAVKAASNRKIYSQVELDTAVREAITAALANPNPLT